MRPTAKDLTQDTRDPEGEEKASVREKVSDGVSVEHVPDLVKDIVY